MDNPKELFEIHRKLDLILRTLGVEPDLGRPHGVYCVVYRSRLLLYSGDYLDCLEYLGRVQGLQGVALVTFDEYNNQ